jgi:hypothetical protein
MCPRYEGKPRNACEGLIAAGKRAAQVLKIRRRRQQIRGGSYPARAGRREHYLAGTGNDRMVGSDGCGFPGGSGVGG